MRISDSLDLPQLLDDAGMCWDWEEVATMDRGEIEWTPKRWRSAVTQLEEHLEESGRVLVGKDTEELCPITNSFGDGCYVREWLCPPGVFTISRIHRFAHPFFVLEGEVSVMTEAGVERIKAPHYGITQPGTKRVLYTHTQTKWVTVHVTDLTDPDQIVEEMTAKSFKELPE
jgi:hypothetical protein